LRSQYQDEDSFEECGSILDCLREDGEIDVEKFIAQQTDMSLKEMSFLLERGMITNDAQVIQPQHCSFMRRNRRSMFYQVEAAGGEKRAATPTDCQWYKVYLEFPMINIPKFHVVFCRRFRLPYAQFIQLLSDSQENNWFPRWSRWNSKAPLSLLILGALRYLGRGWTFDDLEEQTLISHEVHRNFFHEFIKVGGSIWYQMYVTVPLTVDECETHVHEFKMAGFNGCMGSSDATHIAVEKCSYRLRNAHLGAKQHLTVRSFNLTANHRRKILSVTTGKPGRWNDKTIVLFDDFVRGMYEGKFSCLLIVLLSSIMLT
jgi:hypothetical protein